MNALSTTHLTPSSPSSRRFAGRRAALVGGVAIGLLALSGCGGASEAAQTSGSPSPAPMSTPASTPTSTPSGSAGTSGIPTPDAETAAACEQKIPLTAIQDAEGNGSWQQIRYVDKPLSELVSGPAAAQAAGSAKIVLDCGWGVPQSDSSIRLTVADFVDPDARGALVSALDSSDFTRTDQGGFTFYVNRVEGMGGTTGYAFDGKTNWYILSGSMPVEDAQAYLLTATQADNVF